MFVQLCLLWTATVEAAHDTYVCQEVSQLYVPCSERPRDCCLFAIGATRYPVAPTLGTENPKGLDSSKSHLPEESNTPDYIRECLKAWSVR